MSKKLFHVHQGVICDAFAATIYDALDYFSYIKSSDLIDSYFAHHWVDFFGVDTLGDVGVLQSYLKIVFIPIIEQLLDGFYT